METIEQAAMVHGIEPQSLVDEINDFLCKRRQVRNREIKDQNSLIIECLKA